MSCHLISIYGRNGLPDVKKYEKKTRQEILHKNRTPDQHDANTFGDVLELYKNRVVHNPKANSFFME